MMPVIHDPFIIDVVGKFAPPLLGFRRVLLLAD